MTIVSQMPFKNVELMDASVYL